MQYALRFVFFISLTKRMNTIRYYLTIIILLAGTAVYGQGRLEGKIIDSSDPHETGLAGANLVWAGTTTGTSTNAAGYFSIRRVRGADKLVVSFVGYSTDTLQIGPDEEYISHSLSQNNEIPEIVVTGRASGTYINKLDPVLTYNISGAELCKAACCNLSESFETNASVDVNYSDASTGAKQIQLLGLAGSYTQIMSENIPSVYGLNTAYGLNYIPGSWMESIQISKGTSSVRNGYESIAGQINVEYKKPRTSEIFHINGFINDAGRGELNANASLLLNNRLSTMVMGHAEQQNSAIDHNHDGFRDEPDIRQYNFFNRWDYMTERFSFRTGIKVLEEERTGGQLSFHRGNEDTWTDGFGISINTRRLEGFAKMGGMLDADQTMSIGWIQNFSYHDQDSWFGERKYTGVQKAYYSNLMYQFNPGLGKHSIDAGFSYKYDQYDEALSLTSFGRKESVPGIFAQYTYTDSARMTVIAGIRTDFHNLYGTLLTPRVHLRYVINDHLTLRASAGKGFRSGNVLAENSFLLASSRGIGIPDNLDIEEAWNSGMSLSSSIPYGGKILKLSAEVFRTSFLRQIIIDMDANPDEVRFYNLDGKSYSNILQLEASSSIFEGFELLAAWRWNDVRMTIDGMLREKPLASRYKGLLTASWLTHLRKWQFDYTLQLNGPGRIPSTASNPEQYRGPETFKAYTVMNAQVTYNFRKWNVYIGSENLTGFRQSNPIIASEDPFGEFFDSSLIWGPVHGRKLYAGFRVFFNRDV